ncbi:MAG TPA: hypothetical protein VJ861_13190 [Treponemataceae bacterium]|nr:hypothetical protein [Treponemataceae bacterium]
MIILDISDINRKENFIYYRREFTATVLFDLLGRNTPANIEFVIETAPTGKKNVQIKFIETVDYPLIPLVQALKIQLIDLDNEQKLP